MAHADFTYGYADALRDGGVVRPVYFPRVDGEMEWTTASGDVINASFQDELTKDQMSMRLRTALSLEGEWMPSVLARANEQLRAIRQDHREAGGLVIAIDQDHAQGIARLLRDRFGDPADVVVSDDPTASKKIAEFSQNDRPWLVAVRMVSEGVDIPRLRVGVFATTTSTELFFRQAVGRFVRWQIGPPQPEGLRLHPRRPETALARVRDRRGPASHPAPAGQRRRRRRLRRRRRPRRPGPPRRRGRTADAVLRRVVDGNRHHGAHGHRGRACAYEPLFSPDDLTAARYDDDIEIAEPRFVADPSLSLDLPGGADGGRTRAVGLTQRRRTQGRPAHPQRPRRQTPRRHHGWGHAKVQGEMNRLAGVTRVATATTEQLERRLRYAESWLRKLQR